MEVPKISKYPLNGFLIFQECRTFLHSHYSNYRAFLSLQIKKYRSCTKKLFWESDFFKIKPTTKNFRAVPVLFVSLFLSSISKEKRHLNYTNNANRRSSLTFPKNFKKSERIIISQFQKRPLKKNSCPHYQIIKT